MTNYVKPFFMCLLGMPIFFFWWSTFCICLIIFITLSFFYFLCIAFIYIIQYKSFGRNTLLISYPSLWFSFHSIFCFNLFSNCGKIHIKIYYLLSVLGIFTLLCSHSPEFFIFHIWYAILIKHNSFVPVPSSPWPPRFYFSFLWIRSF